MASVDNIWSAVMYFSMAIFFVGLMIFWNVLGTGADDLWEANPTTQQIKADGQSLANNFDFIMVMVWVGLHLGILATSFLLRTHPAMYLVAIILTILLVMIAAPLSNAWLDFCDDGGEVTASCLDMPKTNYIITNFPNLEIIWAFITIVVTLGLARVEGLV